MRKLEALREQPLPKVHRGLTEQEVAALKADSGWRKRIRTLLVRPFDLRPVLAAEYFLVRPRRAVLQHLGRESDLGLIATRQTKEEPGALVTRWLTGHKVISRHDPSFVFPLYLRLAAGRLANLDPGFLASLGLRCGEVPAPPKVLAYLYAVLWSPAYRSRYRELLKRDFPRIPLPRGPELFAALAALGNELINLHLLRAPVPAGAAEPWTGDLADLARRYPDVWRYRIGAYEVLPRWLEARKGRGRMLAPGEIRRLAAMAAALRRTLEIQARLAALPFD